MNAPCAHGSPHAVRGAVSGSSAKRDTSHRVAAGQMAEGQARGARRAAAGRRGPTLHEEGFSKNAHVRCRKVPLFGNHGIWPSFFFAFGGVAGASAS
eukprot:3567323-Prymnesium_polylepis.1